MYLIFFRILSIFNIHTQEEGEGFKETNNSVYQKWCNSWIIQKTNAVLNWIQNPTTHQTHESKMSKQPQSQPNLNWILTTQKLHATHRRETERDKVEAIHAWE